MPEKIVIIGSGPAGWTAAIYAARANLKPLLYEGAGFGADGPLGQLNLTTEVENFPAWPWVDNDALGAFSKSSLPADRYDGQSFRYQGKYAHKGKRAVTGPELMEYMRQQAINFETRVVGDNIAKVDFSKHPFRLTPADGPEIEALTVVIATGAKANYLGLDSEERFKNHGVSACATCDGALPRFKNKPLIVVGGGDTAVEEATHLSKFASEIYLVHRRDSLRASKIMQKRLFDNPKIKPKWNREVAEVLGNDKDGVTGARLKDKVAGNTEDVAVTGVFVAIGHTPNTAFLGGQLQTDDKGYIIWTRPQRTYTSVEGVFAAGDVADNHYRQAVTAAGTGCMAALDAERWLAEKGLN
jgi:thioredoxin reductase (NADPH)